MLRTAIKPTNITRVTKAQNNLLQKQITNLNNKAFPQHFIKTQKGAGRNVELPFLL
jgi:hypothetical protein